MIQELDRKYPNVDIVLSSIVGSHQFKTSSENSDVDVFGIFIPKTKNYYDNKSIIGLDEVEITNIIEEKDSVYNNVSHDIKLFNIIRFYKLIKFGNIDCITFIYSDNFIRYNDITKTLVEWRDNFITKQAVSSTLYYGLTQIQNLKKNRNFTKQAHIDRVEKYGYDTKMAAHSVRLIEYGKFMVENGFCDPSHNHKFLRSIREGEYTKEEMIEYVEKHQKEYRVLMEKSKLPEETPVEFELILRSIMEKYTIA